MDGMGGMTGLLFLIVVIGFLMMYTGTRAREQARVNARLASMERKLDAVMRRLEIEESRTERSAVMLHLQQGNKIAAIKAYRDETGAGLAEAKNAVEEIARRQGLL